MTKLTGTLSTLVGGVVPAKAVLKITAPAVKDSTGKRLLTGGRTVPFTKAGTLCVDLVPTDTAGTDPVAWQYGFQVKWDGGSLPQFFATITGTTVDLVDLVKVNPADPAYLPGPDRGLPSYIAKTAAKVYDPVAASYNWKPENTRKLRASLSRAMVGGLAEWVGIGDSLMAGCVNDLTASFDRLRAWPISMRDELARHGVPAAGTGFVRCCDNSTADARWVSAGPWTESIGTFSQTTSAASKTFTTDKAGDRIRVRYYDAGEGGHWKISVNGATTGAGFLAVTNTGPAGWKWATLSAPIAIGQTVVVTSIDGYLLLAGLSIHSAAAGGLLVHNIAQSSSSATGTGAAPTAMGWVDASGPDRLGTVYSTITTTGADPDVLFIALGSNDKALLGATNTATVDAIKTLRNRYPTADVVLIANTQLRDTLIAAAVWESYLAALYTLAETLDCPLLDFRARLGNYAALVAAGLTVDNAGHLTAATYAGLGRAAGMLAAS